MGTSLLCRAVEGARFAPRAGFNVAGSIPLCAKYHGQNKRLFMHRDYHSKIRLLVSCSPCKVVQHSCVEAQGPARSCAAHEPRRRQECLCPGQASEVMEGVRSLSLCTVWFSCRMISLLSTLSSSWIPSSGLWER